MKDPKEQALLELKVKIENHKDWWIFPEEFPVRGFMGTGSILIAGDQPSQSPWHVGHPNRVAYYQTLKKVGIPNAHLTDIYKRRGKPSALKESIPSDFEEHVRILKQEIEIVKPTHIVALGMLAQELLIKKIIGSRVSRMWHFHYVVLNGKLSEYEQNMREAIWG